MDTNAGRVSVSAESSNVKFFLRHAFVCQFNTDLSLNNNNRRLFISVAGISQRVSPYVENTMELSDSNSKCSCVFLH